MFQILAFLVDRAVIFRQTFSQDMGPEELSVSIVYSSPREKKIDYQLGNALWEIPFMHRPPEGVGLLPHFPSVEFSRQGEIYLQHPWHLLGLPSSLQCLIMASLVNHFIVCSPFLGNRIGLSCILKP